jgi:hypothetical protein
MIGRMVKNHKGWGMMSDADSVVTEVFGGDLRKYSRSGGEGVTREKKFWAAMRVVLGGELTD